MRYLLQILFLLILTSASAQKATIKRILTSTKTKYIPVYEIDTSLASFSISSEFGKEIIKKVNLEGKRIIKIDYVYSKFTTSKDYNQLKLNYYRLGNLFKAYPVLASLDHVPWSIYAETGCNSREDCRKLFHGFVVYYSKLHSEAAMKKEKKYIESYMDDISEKMAKADSLKTIQLVRLKCKFPESSKTFSETFYYRFKRNKPGPIKLKESVKFKAKLTKKGRIRSVEFEKNLGKNHDRFVDFFRRNNYWYPARIDGKLSVADVFGHVKFPVKKNSIHIDHYEMDFDNSVVDSFNITRDGRCNCFKWDTSYAKLLPFVARNDVSNTLKRNADKWKDMLVAVDVTSSMHPYSADILMWLKLRVDDKIRAFVFFNDGDRKADKKKKIGSTGGIYMTKDIRLESVKYTMYEAMSRGYGGDLPENNFEAIVEGQKFCPDCDDFVLIADNYAFPRDWKLLKGFEGNLKMIVCGAQNGIDRKYLNLAKKYKFSLHTLNQDLDKLWEMKEGETIMIEGQKFKVERGRFIRLRTL